MIRFSAALVLVLSLSFSGFAWDGGGLHAAPLEAVTIVTKGGPQRFMVEKAITDAQTERGLMFRRKLPARGGMLFDFHTDQTIRMWMKNTLIPLDMMFIRADGEIARIATETEPESTAIISSETPVRAVLEVRGGTAKSLGIAPGDKVFNRMFRTR